MGKIPREISPTTFHRILKINHFSIIVARKWNLIRLYGLAHGIVTKTAQNSGTECRDSGLLGVWMCYGLQSVGVWGCWGLGVWRSSRCEGLVVWGMDV